MNDLWCFQFFQWNYADIEILQEFRQNLEFWSEKHLAIPFWNPSIYNILHWVAWTMGQTNGRPRVWRSKYYFFYTFYRLLALKTLYFYFCNFSKKIIKWIERIFAKYFARNYDKEIITLGRRFICPIVQATQCNIL